MAKSCFLIFLLILFINPAFAQNALDALFEYVPGELILGNEGWIDYQNFNISKASPILDIMKENRLANMIQELAICGVSLPDFLPENTTAMASFQIKNNNSTKAEGWFIECKYNIQDYTKVLENANFTIEKHNSEEYYGKPNYKKNFYVLLREDGFLFISDDDFLFDADTGDTDLSAYGKNKLKIEPLIDIFSDPVVIMIYKGEVGYFTCGFLENGNKYDGNLIFSIAPPYAQDFYNSKIKALSQQKEQNKILSYSVSQHSENKTEITIVGSDDLDILVDLIFN